VGRPPDQWAKHGNKWFLRGRASREARAMTSLAAPAPAPAPVNVTRRFLVESPLPRDLAPAPKGIFTPGPISPRLGNDRIAEYEYVDRDNGSGTGTNFDAPGDLVLWSHDDAPRNVGTVQGTRSQAIATAARMARNTSDPDHLGTIAVFQAKDGAWQLAPAYLADEDDARTTRLDDIRVRSHTGQLSALVDGHNWIDFTTRYPSQDIVD
jgi:hypothetical protein